jgi:PST family polysaccharide transporter/lipopolysaccharide exporter
MNLKTVAAKGVGWTTLSTYIEQIVSMATRIVLSRLLFPEDFGVVAAASLVVSSIKTLSNFGLNYAIVQRKERAEEAANTAITILFVFAIVNYFLVYNLAPVASQFFDDNNITILIKILGINIFLAASSIVPSAVIVKQFRFKQMCFVDLFASITLSTVTITLALLLAPEKRMYALIVGPLARSFVDSVANWKYSRFKPRIQFSWDRAKELLHYGKYFFGLSVAMYIYDQIDNFAIGSLLGVTALGYYSFAYNFGTRLSLFTRNVFSNVPLSLYAKLQDDIRMLKIAYFRTLRYCSCIAMPLFGGAFVLAPEVITVLFGERWHGSIAPFRILCIFFALRAIDTTTGELYAATGNPKYNQKFGFINLISVAALMYPLIYVYGISGAAVALAIGRAVTMYLNFAQCCKLLNCSKIEVCKTLYCSILATSGMMSVVLLLKRSVFLRTEFVPLCLLTLSGIASYCCLMYLIRKELVIEIATLVRSIFKQSTNSLGGSSLDWR